MTLSRWGSAVRSATMDELQSSGNVTILINMVEELRAIRSLIETTLHSQAAEKEATRLRRAPVTRKKSMCCAGGGGAEGSGHSDASGAEHDGQRTGVLALSLAI